jgi:hypothetical protein
MENSFYQACEAFYQVCGNLCIGCDIEYFDSHLHSSICHYSTYPPQKLYSLKHYPLDRIKKRGQRSIEQI